MLRRSWLWVAGAAGTGLLCAALWLHDATVPDWRAEARVRLAPNLATDRGNAAIAHATGLERLHGTAMTREVAARLGFDRDPGYVDGGKPPLMVALDRRIGHPPTAPWPIARSNGCSPGPRFSWSRAAPWRESRPAPTILRRRPGSPRPSPNCTSPSGPRRWPRPNSGPARNSPPATPRRTRRGRRWPSCAAPTRPRAGWPRSTANCAPAAPGCTTRARPRAARPEAPGKPPGGG